MRAARGGPTSILGWVAGLGIHLGLTGCVGVPAKELHVVDGKTVVSSAPAPSVYAAYLRVRMALEDPRPDLDLARQDMRYVLSKVDDDAQVWTTAAELELLSGDDAAALAAIERALALAPAYEPAIAVRASLEGAGGTAIR